MSGMMNAGAAWRHLRSDRSALDKRVGRATLRRVLGFAVPHRRIISVFLALPVVDASLVVASPLLVQRIVDDGILDGDRVVVKGLLDLALGDVEAAFRDRLPEALGSGTVNR